MDCSGSSFPKALTSRGSAIMRWPARRSYSTNVLDGASATEHPLKSLPRSWLHLILDSAPYVVNHLNGESRAAMNHAALFKKWSNWLRRIYGHQLQHLLTHRHVFAQLRDCAGP